jgi:two-component system chemotaxis response regulator CheY
MSGDRATASAEEMPLDRRPLVLIAEDEETLAAVVEEVVESAGYCPVVAFHGRQALAVARDRWPALLITDLMMPHLDGVALIAALHAEARTTQRAMPPAILMTAASLHHARTAGADAILRKPFALRDLEALLRRFLGDSGSQLVVAEEAAMAPPIGERVGEKGPRPAIGGMGDGSA